MIPVIERGSYLEGAKVLWYVYLVQCSDGTYYTGITTDLERRISEHNGKGTKGARYTKTRRPVKLVYFEESSSRGEATVREREIKNMKKDNKKKLAESMEPVKRGKV